MRAIPKQRTIRLTFDWPIQGLKMQGWIVEKEARAAALLVEAGLAQYVSRGTPIPRAQLEWGQALERASRA